MIRLFLDHYLAADLWDADLRGADLNNVILLATNLSEVEDGTLTVEQLTGEDAPLLCGTLLPDSISLDPNRDCPQLPQVLSERYSVSLEEAKEQK